MDAIVRTTAMYFLLWLLLRAGGKRSLAQATMFDFILMLVVSEATQQALLGNDFSITNAILVIMTLVGIDIGMSLLKQRFPKVERAMEGLPLIVVANGRPCPGALERARMDEEDVLAAARKLQGLERMDQIKFAVLEASGGITVIPYQ